MEPSADLLHPPQARRPGCQSPAPVSLALQECFHDRPGGSVKSPFAECRLGFSVRGFRRAHQQLVVDPLKGARFSTAGAKQRRDRHPRQLTSFHELGSLRPTREPLKLGAESSESYAATASGLLVGKRLLRVALGAPTEVGFGAVRLLRAHLPWACSRQPGAP